MDTEYSEGEILVYLGNSFADSVEDLLKVSLSLILELAAPLFPIIWSE